MTESPDELAVEQLLAESESIRGWLARVDHPRTTVPEAVRHRVRADYQRRLDDVTAGLRAHGDLIASKLREDRSEHAELQSRVAASREALAEAELRHAVGEYDAARFASERQRHDSDIESCQVTLGAVAERIARLEEIDALVQRAPRTFDIDIDLSAVESVEVSEVPPVSTAEPEPVVIDELAPDPIDTRANLEEVQPDEPVPDLTAAPIPDSGPLSFRPSGEIPRVASPPSARPRPFENAPPLGIPAADVPPRFIRPGEVLAKQPAPPVTAPTPEAVAPAAAGGATVEVNAAPGGRTLRCGECGAMNRPLEWYCEKCGAELTAV